jgi:transcriptional regulator with XRE-family HTH domain
MTKIGDKITQLRKQKGWSQTELAKQISASREAIGKYERNEALPSVETAKKIANAFGVTLDFLVDDATTPSLDKETVKRINDIQEMDSTTKTILFNVIDTYIQHFKTKQAFAK